MSKTLGKHNGAAQLGKGLSEVAYVHVQRAPSGKGGKTGTAAAVSTYNAASVKVGKVAKTQSGYATPMTAAKGGGKAAGGTTNMKASPRKVGSASNNSNVPQSGSAKFAPKLTKAAGTSAPKRVAK